MSSEHLTSRNSEQPLQREGTNFGNNDQIDLRASGLDSLELQHARAEVAAATAAASTQNLEGQVEARLEYIPLKQHEVIALLGRKVSKLRTSYQEDILDLENDEAAPYVFNPQTNEPAEYAVNQNDDLAKEAEAIINAPKNEVTDDTKDQFGLTA